MLPVKAPNQKAPKGLFRAKAGFISDSKTMKKIRRCEFIKVPKATALSGMGLMYSNIFKWEPA